MWAACRKRLRQKSCFMIFKGKLSCVKMRRKRKSKKKKQRAWFVAGCGGGWEAVVCVCAVWPLCEFVSGLRMVDVWLRCVLWWGEEKESKGGGRASRVNMFTMIQENESERQLRQKKDSSFKSKVQIHSLIFFFFPKTTWTFWMGYTMMRHVWTHGIHLIL